MITNYQKNRLESQYLLASRYLSHLTEAKIDTCEKDKWNIREQLTHLVIYQPEFLRRMKLVVSGTEPLFERYVADKDQEFIKWKSKSIQDLLARLAIDRKEIYQFINTLTSDESAMLGFHPVYGGLSLVDWTEFFLLHEAHHLFSIFQLAHKL